MVAVIVILFLLNINLWVRLHNLSQSFMERKYDEYSFKKALNEDIEDLYRITSLHDDSILACNFSISENKGKIDSIIHGILEEPEHESVVTQDQIDEIINRIEELEKSDFPKFDDALNEGLQNLLNYNFDVASGGKK